MKIIKNMKFFVKNILPFLLCGGFALGLGFGISGYYKEVRKLEANHGFVTGEVIKSRITIRQGSSDNIITFRYKVNGTTYKSTKGFDVLLKAGESCTVKYETDNPKNCVLVGSDHDGVPDGGNQDGQRY